MGVYTCIHGVNTWYVFHVYTYSCVHDRQLSPHYSDPGECLELQVSHLGGRGRWHRSCGGQHNPHNRELAQKIALQFRHL